MVSDCSTCKNHVPSRITTETYMGELVNVEWGDFCIQHWLDTFLKYQDNGECPDYEKGSFDKMFVPWMIEAIEQNQEAFDRLKEEE